MVLVLAVALGAPGCADDASSDGLACPDGRFASVSDVGNPEAPRTMASDVVADLVRATGVPASSWEGEDLGRDSARFLVRDGSVVVAEAIADHADAGWYVESVRGCGDVFGGPNRG